MSDEPIPRRLAGLTIEGDEPTTGGATIPVRDQLDSVLPRSYQDAQAAQQEQRNKGGRPKGAVDKRKRRVVRTAAVRQPGDLPPAPRAAEDRAAPPRSDPDGEPLTRRSREHREVNRFAIPQSRIKAGWDVEFKTVTVLGQMVSGSELMDIHEGGWRPEKAKDWPEFSPPGTSPDAVVEFDGQRLYGRPKKFTIAAREEDRQFAERQLADRARAAQEGRLDRRGSDGGESLSDLSGVVRPVPLGVSLEGEAGYAEHRRNG